MREYFPDRWVMLKVTPDNGDPHFYKVFATWYGGFTQGEWWKVSSGIISSKKSGNTFLLKMRSGSEYTLLRSDHDYRTSGFTSGVLDLMLHEYPELSILPYEDAIELLENNYARL